MTALHHTMRLALLAACMLPMTWLQAADYPTKSIRLIVPFVPGGGTDVLARIISPKLVELLGQQVVVDNRGGAGSVIGTQMVASAASTDRNAAVVSVTARLVAIAVANVDRWKGRMTPPLVPPDEGRSLCAFCGARAIAGGQ